NASIEDALSSLRAAQIIAAIATAAAADFDREPMSVVDSSIANPTDAGSRQELGPPTFLERAHAIAANTCRGIDIDEVATVGATVLLTALQILDDAKWWAKLNPPQQQGLLQVMVCLGSEDQVADARRRAGQGLLALIRLSQAPAAKSRCARQFTAGLREKWNAADYDAGSLNDVERALADWDGEICTAPLHRAVLGHERARHTQSTTPQTTLRLAEALLKCAVDEHRVGNVIAAASFGEEALSLLRDLTSGLDTTEHQLTLAGALRTVAVVLQDGDETQARAGASYPGRRSPARYFPQGTTSESHSTSYVHRRPGQPFCNDW
ncbi:MAG: hypothetical protein IPF55_13310, partial [Rhodoferax sp.]|nr:hypothetical protein [Rhodoferax sp.]